MCICVYVCICERDRQTDRHADREGGADPVGMDTKLKGLKLSAFQNL